MSKRPEPLLALLAIIGCTVSFVGGWLSKPTNGGSEGSPSQPHPSQTRLPAAPQVVVPSKKPVLEACKSELSIREAENGMLRSQVRSLGGEFSEWPEATPFARATIEDWLARHAPQDVGHLEHLDCDEFPCIAVVSLPADAPPSSTVVQPLANAFSDDMGVAIPSVHLVGRDHGTWGIVPLGPHLEGGSPASRRLPNRIQELTEIVIDADY